MVNLLCRIYKRFMDVFLILFIIGLTVTGFLVSGYYFAQDDFFKDFDIKMAFLGGVIGLVGSFLFELTVFPPFLILFNIDSKLKKDN